MESAKQPATWTIGMFLQQLPSHDMCVADFYENNPPLPDEGQLWGNGNSPSEESCRFANTRTGE